MSKLIAKYRQPTLRLSTAFCIFVLLSFLNLFLRKSAERNNQIVGG
jgi:hypothetical protein